MYKFLFELATDPLGLPIEWHYEYLILAVIGLLAYRLAYSKVGDLYNGGFISGRETGSFLHWLFRFVFSLLFGQSHILLFWQENLSLQIEK